MGSRPAAWRVTTGAPSASLPRRDPVGQPSPRLALSACRVTGPICMIIFAWITLSTSQLLAECYINNGKRNRTYTGEQPPKQPLASCASPGAALADTSHHPRRAAEMVTSCFG